MKGDFEYQSWLDSFEKIKDIPKTDFISSMNVFSTLTEMRYDNLEDIIGKDLSTFLSGFHYHDYKITDSICKWMLEFRGNSFNEILFFHFNITSLLSQKENYPEKAFNIGLLAKKALSQNKVLHYDACLPFLDSQNVSHHLLSHFDIIEKQLQIYDGESPNDFLMYFRLMNEKEFQQYFKKEYLKIIPNATPGSLLLYLEKTIHDEKMLKTKEFKEAFSKKDFERQLHILTALEDQECDTSIIKDLRKQLHKNIECVTVSDTYQHYFEMDSLKFRRIRQEILLSSYLLEGNFNRKYNELINFLKDLKDDLAMNPFQNLWKYQNQREEYWYQLLDSLYEDVVNYSKKSIIQNLYDVSKLEHFMNDMEDGIDYNILVNTNETGNNSSFTPAPCQIMDRFCIINPLNFSHTIYQNFIYGYYLDITEDRILSINPSPIDFDPNITKKKDIGVSVLKGRSPNYWLSMKMFNDITYQNGIYGSIMIETKKEDGSFIQPNCLISLGDDRMSKIEEREAERRNFKVLRLKKQKDTNLECEKAPSHHCG